MRWVSYGLRMAIDSSQSHHVTHRRSHRLASRGPNPMRHSSTSLVSVRPCRPMTTFWTGYGKGAAHMHRCKMGYSAELHAWSMQAMQDMMLFYFLSLPPSCLSPEDGGLLKSLISSRTVRVLASIIIIILPVLITDLSSSPVHLYLPPPPHLIPDLHICLSLLDIARDNTQHIHKHAP